MALRLWYTAEDAGSVGSTVTSLPSHDGYGPALAGRSTAGASGADPVVVLDGGRPAIEMDGGLGQGLISYFPTPLTLRGGCRIRIVGTFPTTGEVGLELSCSPSTGAVIIVDVGTTGNGCEVSAEGGDGTAYKVGGLRTGAFDPGVNEGFALDWSAGTTQVLTLSAAPYTPTGYGPPGSGHGAAAFSGGYTGAVFGWADHYLGLPDLPGLQFLELPRDEGHAGVFRLFELLVYDGTEQVTSTLKAKFPGEGMRLIGTPTQPAKVRTRTGWALHSPTQPAKLRLPGGGWRTVI